MTWDGLTPPYRTIVADPPWSFLSKPGKRGSVQWRAVGAAKYSTMTTDDICELPVIDLADESAHLWLWGVNMLMEDAFRVVRAWGFNPINILTWCKTAPGIGAYLRTNTEHAIFATRGKPMTPEDKWMSSWFESKRTQHSAKPPVFFDIVEQVSPGPYVELFARQPRLGWDSWGHGFE